MNAPARRPEGPRLWRFHGGLHLPDHKAISNVRPIAALALPERLVLPLTQHIGAPARPRVRVGDRVLKGQPIAETAGRVSAALHAPSSGSVRAIEPRAVPHPSGLSAPCIELELDGDERWIELPEPIVDTDRAEPAELLARIADAGIVGLGGAAFPTAVKASPREHAPVHTLIINGAECEPYITCDDRLMRERPGEIVAGARILRRLLGAGRCLLGVEENKPEAIAALRAVADDALEVVTIPTLYPSGSERQLIRILTGIEVPSGTLPAQLGFVCQNVGTAAAVANAVHEGRPLISRIVTVTGGGVATPGNFEVLLGSPVDRLIAAAGGYRPDAKRLVMGGPMMGFTLAGDHLPVVKATNCILVASDAESPDPGPAGPCIRCGRCAAVCPAELLPQQLYWHARARDLERAQDFHLFDCIECGCCAYVCPAHIPLVQYYRYAKQESWAQEEERRKADHARQRHEARLARLERLERERKARLKKKAATVSKAGGDATAKKAAIEAAMKRAAEKKAVLAAAGAAPRNTDNLTAEQRRRIAEVDTRRAAAKKSAAKEEE